MPDAGRCPDAGGPTSGELERIGRELRASLALTRPDSPTRGPILAHLSAIDAELAQRSGRSQAGGDDIVNLTANQIHQIGELSDQ